MGFGGPIAVIGLFEDELVKKRKWLSEEKFSQLLSICKLLPGPISTQMAIAIAEERSGRWAGFLAGVFFILPAFLLVLILSAIYKHSPVVAQYSDLFTGLQVGALIVIVISVANLWRPYQKQARAWLVFLLSAILIWRFPRWEPVVILFFGFLGAFFFAPKPPREKSIPTSPHPKLSFSFFLAGVSPLVLRTQLFQLFWMCFKAGAFVFGTGLAIVPMFEADSVNHFHFLTHAQFMDGLAIGQITPGPVVITATFIGYQAAGILGALVSTLGMFLPSFINVLILVPLIFGRFAKSSRSKGFIAFAMPAVIGGISGASFKLAGSTLQTHFLVAVFAAGLSLAFWKKIAPWIFIPAVGAVTLAFHFFHIQ